MRSAIILGMQNSAVSTIMGRKGHNEQMPPLVLYAKCVPKNDIKAYALSNITAAQDLRPNDITHIFSWNDN